MFTDCCNYHCRNSGSHPSLKIHLSRKAATKKNCRLYSEFEWVFRCYPVKFLFNSYLSKTINRRIDVTATLFYRLLTKVCYKILEQCRDSKQKHIRQTIFEVRCFRSLF